MFPLRIRPVLFTVTFVIISLIVPLSVHAAPTSGAAISDEVETEIPTLFDLVNLIGVGAMGGSIAIIIERFKWFQRLTPDQKFYVVLGVTIGLPLAATIAVQYVPPDVWVMVESYWQGVARAAIGFLASQGVHLGSKALRQLLVPVVEQNVPPLEVE